MGREELLERVRYLDGIARTLEQGVVAMLVAVVGGGILFGDPADAALAAVLFAVFATGAGVHAYRLRSHIEDMWGELLRRDPRWAAQGPLILVAMVWAAALAVIAARLLLG